MQVSAHVKQDVCSLRDNRVGSNLADVRIVELIPAPILGIAAERCVVPTTKAAVVVGDSVQIVNRSVFDSRIEHMRRQVQALQREIHHLIKLVSEHAVILESLQVDDENWRSAPQEELLPSLPHAQNKNKKRHVQKIGRAHV